MVLIHLTEKEEEREKEAWWEGNGEARREGGERSHKRYLHVQELLQIIVQNDSELFHFNILGK